jgi:signal peptide peptidase SppA
MDHEVNRILNAATRTPWVILPEKLTEIRSFLTARAHGATITASERAEYVRKAEARQRSNRAGSVAVINVFGVIAQRMNLVMAMSGGTSTELLGKEIQSAVADPNISAIVLNIDSPGGVVSGIPELHSQILSLRGTKPIVAAANSMAASGAYWLASAADEISVTPSGEVGSIGVYCAHFDESAAYDQMGVKPTLISAGRFKTEGNPFEPLSDEAKAAIQADVDQFYSMFVNAVARGRGVSPSTVRSNFGQGRMLLAGAAKAAGMVNRVESLDETISRLRGVPRRASTAETQRAKDQSREEALTRRMIGLKDHKRTSDLMREEEILTQIGM